MKFCPMEILHNKYYYIKFHCTPYLYSLLFFSEVLDWIFDSLVDRAHCTPTKKKNDVECY